MKRVLYLIIIVLVLSASLSFYFFKKSETQTEKESELLLQGLDGNYTICTLPYGNEKNILDPNYLLVIESKQVILEDNNTENYFEDHFRFLCAVDEPGHRKVRWLYAIGEYKKIIEDDVGTTDNDRHEIINVHSVKGSLKKISDITKVIQKKRALEIIGYCIGEFDEEKVNFGFCQKTYPSLGITTLCLTAYSIDVTENNLGNTQFTMGLIDLETGECEKKLVNQNAVRDPNPPLPILPLPFDN
ncbi:MAG: hypothetical protein Q7S27_05565 [Nanoarchaeota archaeon]|nr:hypothetical protein [Nanoarchaeota archaeon]